METEHRKRDDQASQLIQMAGLAFGEAGFDQAQDALTSYALERWPDGPKMFGVEGGFEPGDGTATQLAFEMLESCMDVLFRQRMHIEALRVKRLLQHNVPNYQELVDAAFPRQSAH